jgi:hypothetical protein
MMSFSHANPARREPSSLDKANSGVSLGPGSERAFVKMKTDGMNPVSSASVYRIFLSVFVFYGINGNGTENGTGYTRTGTENG